MDTIKIIKQEDIEKVGIMNAQLLMIAYKEKGDIVEAIINLNNIDSYCIYGPHLGGIRISGYIFDGIETNIIKSLNRDSFIYLNNGMGINRNGIISIEKSHTYIKLNPDALFTDSKKVPSYNIETYGGKIVIHDTEGMAAIQSHLKNQTLYDKELSNNKKVDYLSAVFAELDRNYAINTDNILLIKSAYNSLGFRVYVNDKKEGKDKEYWKSKSIIDSVFIIPYENLVSLIERETFRLDNKDNAKKNRSKNRV